MSDLTWKMKSWMGELLRLVASSRMEVEVAAGDGKVKVTLRPCFS